MPQIAVLDKHTVDQIAAGEVVERPASVVKELVENAIDAGATAITVEIKQGGTSFIRITDNGCGIEKEQISTAFLRHATSKITRVSDLLTIQSLGFRGEALSSIAAVAQVEFISKTNEGLTGARYVIEGGVEKSLEEIGAPEGTTILVRNLFYNVPARSKFLKTATTEGNYISAYMEQLALSQPCVSFKYILNGQVRFQTTGRGELKEIIYQIYGRDIARELLPVSYHDGELSIQGYIGKPVISRGNRNFENYYVNGRYVKDKIIMKGIEEGYRTFMMQHQYPFTCLCYTLPGTQVDINVHPAKMEVRFSSQEDIYFHTKEAILQTLHSDELVFNTGERDTKKTSASVVPKKEVLPEPFEQKRREQVLPAAGKQDKPLAPPPKATKLAAWPVKEEQVHYGSTPKTESPVSVQQNAQPAPRQASSEKKEASEPLQLSFFDKESHFPLAEEKNYRIIGQLFETYWLFELEDTLYIMDQHAAHEKVMFERLMREHKERTVTSQMISPPIILHPSLQEMELLKEHRDVFMEYGFELEPFGSDAMAIRSIPHNLYGIADRPLFDELLAECEQNLCKSESREVIGQRIATMACKAAVKGSSRMSVPEAQSLVRELMTLDNPYQCPHGRPTIIRMTKTEIEKKFRRIV